MCIEHTVLWRTFGSAVRWVPTQLHNWEFHDTLFRSIDTHLNNRRQSGLGSYGGRRIPEIETALVV
jgi:hypothetical protein